MNLHLSLRVKTVIVMTCLFASTSFSQEHPPEGVVEVQSAEPQLVEVLIPQDNLASYKERRERHGFSFALGYESLELINYVSTLSNNTYDQLFGSNAVPLIKFNADYKYNFDIASTTIGFDFGTGSLTDDRVGESRTLDVMKYGLSAKLLADVIWEEPYVVPYVGISFWQMEIGEKSPTDNFSATTQLGYNYSLGLLLQLDWIDRETAKSSTFNWGLENTFVDIYATKYAKTDAVDDANTETDFIYGAALRVEF